MKKLFIILSISFVVVQFSCIKNNCRENFQYTLAYDMYANTDTINIGDTVFLNINTPTLLQDELSGEMIQFPEKLLRQSINITRIDKDSVTLGQTYSTGAILDFDTLLFKGSMSKSFYLWFRDIKYNFIDGHALGSFGFIAKSSGTFVFDLSDLSYYMTDDEPLSTYDIYLNDHDCTEYYWHSLYINNNLDNNYYIIQQHHVHYDTTKFFYSEYENRANKNSVIDFKKNLQYGTFSVVVK